MPDTCKTLRFTYSISNKNADIHRDDVQKWHCIQDFTSKHEFKSFKEGMLVCFLLTEAGVTGKRNPLMRNCLCKVGLPASLWGVDRVSVYYSSQDAFDCGELSVKDGQRSGRSAGSGHPLHFDFLEKIRGWSIERQALHPWTEH